MSRSVPRRIGTNLPLQGISLAGHKPVLELLRSAGLTDVWTNEYNRTDASLPLGLMAGWDDTVNLVSAILNIATRGPALLAMTLAGLGDLAPGRVTAGLGTSSVVPVEQWNGMSADRPYTRMKETLAFLDDALAGNRAGGDYSAIQASGFQLAYPPKVPPRIAVAALGPRMQQLAAASADTLITGFVSPSDIAKIRANVQAVERARPEPLEILVGVFVQPAGGDRSDVIARRCITQYFNTPPYAAQQRWLGRDEALAPMWERWAAGDRRGALAAIPDSLVGDLIISGDPFECASRLAPFFDAGVSGINLIIPPGLPDASAGDQIEFLGAVIADLRASDHADADDAEEGNR